MRAPIITAKDYGRWANKGAYTLQIQPEMEGYTSEDHTVGV